MKFTIGAINTDKTNRHKSINNTSSLGEDICKRYIDNRLDIISLSEVSSLKTIHHFADKLPEDKSIKFVNSQKRSDYIVQAWDTEKFQLNGNYDVSFNYIGVPLLNKEFEENQLHISLHLPHKSGKVIARNLLQQYVQEKIHSNEYEHIFIHGDFNATPEEIKLLFQESTLTIEGETTKLHRKIDNIVVAEDNVDFESEIISEDHHYTHHIVTSRFNF